MVEQQFQKSHSTNAPPYQTKYATDNEKTTKTNVSNPMSKQILKNTPSQSRERPLSLQLPPAAIGYHVAKRNPAATITLRHTTKCSTSDYTFCRRIIGKTTHHNLPHYNIVSKGYTHSLPPCDLVGKDTHGNSPPYHIIGKGHAHSLPPYNITGRGINCNPSPYNIVDRGHAHRLSPFNIGRKDTHGNSSPCNFVGRDYPHPLPPYNIAGKGHATILLLNIISGEGIFRDNEQWLS